MPKIIFFVGTQVRSALNEQRAYVSAEELSDAIWQASNTVFGHYVGHPALYRPGQPIAPRAIGLNDRIEIALNPFLRSYTYLRNAPVGTLPVNVDGVINFPVAVDAQGLSTLENSYQYTTAVRPAYLVDGVLTEPRRVTEINDNAVLNRQANSITAPSAKYTIRVSIADGYKILPIPDQVILQYLAAPARPVFSEVPDPSDPDNFIYDDATSVELGWKDATAINEIIAHAIRLLGGQVKDAQAIQNATQTALMGA